jgi:hypothetical protein
VTLEPGEFALVVREDFDEHAPYDIAPVRGTPLVRVPHVGRNGLANSGEPLRLKDPKGRVRSEFATVLKPKPGRSLARISPSALSERADSLALHGDPGASPGAENSFLQDGL